MTRPTVLIASTKPTMACALGERLKQPCRELGLRVEVCPGGESGSQAKASTARFYCSAEVLFDELERRDPMELADTLVVLDLGSALEDAFSPSANSGSAWRASSQIVPGVAVELLLRFPQVFPVFLSTSVPVGDGVDILDKLQIPHHPTIARDRWPAFWRLRDALGCINTSLARKDQEEPCHLIRAKIDSVLALQVPLHFVSPLDNMVGLLSTLRRFASGMRCWFDPTGLRSLVRNRFLATVFGRDEDWSNTWEQRKVILNRLEQTTIAVDEEREFAMLNGYAAYKYGQRAWIITSYSELMGNPLWNASPEIGKTTIIRDVDLRFPDIPRNQGRTRSGLRDVEGDDWANALKGYSNHNLHIRAVSSTAMVVTASDASSCGIGCWSDDNFDYGQRRINRNIQYIGLHKPVGSLYSVRQLLETRSNECRSSAREMASLISGIAISDEGDENSETSLSDAHKGHGAPYSNLQMAESLLKQSRSIGRDTASYLIGAFLAGEAYQLTLGMSKTTSLEALLLLHRNEVAAEVEFPGVSHDIDILSRLTDIETTLDNLLPPANAHALDVHNMFLSQFWSELRRIYRGGEQFRAADAANAQSLIHSRWLTDDTRKGFIGAAAIPNRILLRLKYRGVIEPATSLVAWLRCGVILNLVFSFIYLRFGKIDGNGRAPGDFLDMLYSVFLSFLSQSPTQVLEEVAKFSGGWIKSAIVVHLSLAYVLLGMLIAMIYRKITRG